MSDRRAVSAGHPMSGVGASPVAAGTWRVAVGGNRVESMTAEQIAHAFHSGQINVRTPLWAPGSTGWQVLGNFEQFQMHPAAYAGAAALAQFEEADDDPTRMWTGGELPDYGAGYEAAEPRPSVRTGTRPVASARPPAARPAPLPPPPSIPQSFQSAPQGYPAAPQAQSYQGDPQALQSAPQASISNAHRMAPTASLPPSRAASAVPMSIPPVRRGRNNGLMLVAGLVGLVGLGSAVLAARGNLGGSENEVATTEATASQSTSAEGNATSAGATTPAPEPKAAEVAQAKYEDAPAAAGSLQNDAPGEKAVAEEPKAEAPATADTKDEAAEAESPKKAASEPVRAKDEPPAKKASFRSTPKRATTKSKSLALARVERAEKAERAEKPEHADKPEKAERTTEKAEKAEASADAPKAAPATAAVNEAAAAALANSANLASSCRPRGGPSGAGKARVIYSNDGEVQSVEILTAKFRDTLTGSCVRMVFRRAKIPAFKGEPPSFIKTFTIPED